MARYCRRKSAQEESTSNHKLHNRFQPLASIKQCFKCGNTGHIARSCHLQAYQKPGPRSEPICYKCGVKGHIARSCRTGSITIITTIKEVLNSTATYTSTPGCYTCGKHGHIARNCMKGTLNAKIMEAIEEYRSKTTK